MSRGTHLARVAVEQAFGARASEKAALSYDRTRGLYHALIGDYATESRRLRSWRDRYAGRRCVIIGNGPSINGMDLAPLRNEVTFGLNRIYLKFGDLGFPTTFLVCVNRLVWEQFAQDIVGAPSTIFAPWDQRPLLPVRDDLYFFRSEPRPAFRRRPAIDGLWEGSTVTFVALQLAFLMGFRKVILIGVDHRFQATGTPNSTVVSGGDDHDHFDSSYFGRGVRWQLPDLDGSERAYVAARDAYAATGREIVDATVGGRLQVFPKVDFASVMAADTGKPLR